MEKHMKIKLKDANLYNCEGFMTDIELVDKINTVFKTGAKEDGETITGMTLDGLIKIEPRDFYTAVKEGETLFTKAEMAKIIKYLSAFDLTLNKMVIANKYKTAYGESRQTQVTNLDVQPSVTYGRQPTDAEVDKAFEEAEAWQKKIDEDPAEQARIAATATPAATQ